MNWGRVVHIFFTLMSFTTIAGYFYAPSAIALFVAASINLISTLLKVGVRNVLSTELFTSSVVADMHLIPAFIIYIVYPEKTDIMYSLMIGAFLCNLFSIVLTIVEAAKYKDEF
ncbi:DUF6394 family protein [Campylobacter corcagiensis]|uniref:Integral membrane protein n=1 Tax=Campylobacter corcagiensis TaxID=1448857 RepID=A0A7M1LEH5_9BACT|nr:DUF6394 family protein [Campylobacter corcagiensis]QKF64996.1 putative membrane protein [Campylobacter corcagiensis]QOQ86850.1 hypothetical protein IMC76_06430 [Campylobacter corcagiensis]